MLSQTGEYALRAALYLARHEDEAPSRVDDAARSLGVPRNYLSKILHEMGKQGLLNSTRGPKGGFRLAEPADRISLARVVERFDPEFLSEEGRCILGRMRCSDRDPCAAHHRWKGVAAAIRSFFRETTLAELAAPAGESATDTLPEWARPRRAEAPQTGSAAPDDDAAE